MTIDEAIIHEKELAEKDYLQGMLCHANPNDEKLDEYVESGRYHEQVTEWLEELKMYKSLAPRELVSEKQRSDRDIEYHKGFSDGYNTAIDNFVKLFKDKTSMENKLIDEIAEQLKGGE